MQSTNPASVTNNVVDTAIASGGASIQAPRLSMDYVSPATLLLEKRRQMLEVQQSLDEQKADYIKKESRFRKTEQQLRKKDLDLQEKLCQFNKFLKDKSDKRQQYLKKTEDETRQKHLRQRELIRKQRELEQVIDRCRMLEDEFRTHEKYEEYLKRIKRKYNQEFTEVEHIVKRFRMLDNARRHLQVKEQAYAKQLEELRKEQSEYISEETTRNLDLHNEKQRLQRALEEQYTQAQELESKVHQIVLQNESQNRELSELVLSTQDIYEKCKSHFRNIHHFQNFMEKNQRSEEEKKAKQAARKPGKEQQTAEELKRAEQLAKLDPHYLQRDISQKLSIIGDYLVDLLPLSRQSDAN